MSFEDLIAGAPSPDDGTAAPIDPRMVVARLTRKGLQSLDQPSQPAAPAPSADFGSDDEVVQTPKAAKPAKAKAPKADLSFGDDDDIVTPPTVEKPAEQAFVPPLPKSRPAGAPQRAVSLLPTAPLPEVQPLEDAGRFRAPSSGSQANMLTGDEAFAEAAGNIQSAEAGVAQARERLAAAEQRMAETSGAKTKRGTPADLQRLAIASEVDTARENLRVAENDLSAASRANPPTQNKVRDAASRLASSVAQMGPDIIGGLARPIDAGLDALGVKGGSGTADTMRDFSERIGRANQPDPTRDDELSAKLGQGAGSAIGFMLTGAVGRAAGASAKATSMVAGGAQNAEQYYREADTLSAPAYKKALAYMTGGAIGATEGFGLGRIADQLDKTTGGGVRRYFGLVLKEMGEEGLQEGVQQFLENIAKFGLYGKDPGDITANVATNALVGALLGMGMAGTMGAPTLLGGRKVDANIPTPTPETVSPEEIQRQATEPQSAAPDATPAPTAAAPVAATPSAPEAESTNLPETPEIIPAEAEKAPENRPSSGADETAILRAYGYSDEQIGDMSAAQRKGEVDEAIASGIQPKAAEDEFGADDRTVGSRNAPVNIETPEDLKAATAAAASDYTPAQGEANNRKLGHVKWNGLDISIETEAGGIRKGQNPKTKETWETRMGAAYGYIKGTVGADNMHVDVFMGDDPKSKQVFVVNEVDGETGKFRQHKVMAGFSSEDAARAAYLGTSSKSEKTLGSVVPMPVAEFKKWIKSGNTKAEVKAPAAKPKVSDDPVSLLQFIASKGGLKPDGDLRAMDAGKHRVQIPGRKGFFGLVKNDGMTLDYARSLAQQEGYFPPDPDNAPPTGSVRDFLNAIEDELRGNRRQKIGEEGIKTARELDRIEDENLHRESIIDDNQKIIEDMLVEYGIPRGLQNLEDTRLAAQIMADEGLDPDDALERAAIRNLENSPPAMATADEISDTFGWGANDAVQPDPAQEDVKTASPEGGAGERPGEEGRDAEPRLDLSGAGDDRARPGESEADQEAIRAEQATDEGSAANSELEFGANDDEVAPQQQPKAKGKAKPETPKKLSKADAEYEAEKKARQAELEAALAKLPDGLDEIIADTKATIDKYDDAMRAGDEAESRKLSQRLSHLEIKANDGTSFGVDTDESDAEKVRNAASAPIGTIPKWGQRGVFTLNVDGMDFIVTHDAGSGPAIFAAHEDKPFPSKTGYRSMLGSKLNGLGKSVETAWSEAIEAYIAEERGSGKKPKQFETPDAWYRLPDNYDESGYPERVGDNWQERKTVAASDADEEVELTLTAKGPWDFNDTWPKPDTKHLEALEREGRNPFDSTEPDAEAVAGMLDEGMNAMMSDIAELRGIDERIDHLKSGATKLKKKQTLEDALKPLQKDRGITAQSLRDARASHAELFGDEAANAMMKEARRRILQEEGTSPEVSVKPTPKAEAPKKPAKAAPAANADVPLDEDHLPTNAADRGLQTLMSGSNRKVKDTEQRKALIDAGYAQGAKLEPTEKGRARWEVVREAINDALADPIWRKITAITGQSDLSLQNDGGIIQDEANKSASRLLNWPVRYVDPEEGGPRLTVTHESLLDLPIVKQVAEATGLTPEVEEDETHQFYHGVDLATNDGWKELVKTKDLTTNDAIVAGAGVNLQYGRLSPENARKLFEAIGETEPKGTLDVLSRFTIDRLDKNNEAINSSIEDDTNARAWAWLKGLEDGYITIKKGYSRATDKLRNHVANRVAKVKVDEAESLAASGAMESAIDKIEAAIEAKDRAATEQAANDARKVLADTSQDIKDAEPDYWDQFDGLIRKMLKPGYVTAKQEIEGDAPASKPTASWVIKEKATGNIVMETFDRKKVDALNTKKYEAVPIAEHLASLSEKPKATTEKTEAGEQTVLLGAEKIGDGKLAQRKADERLKPKVAQKSADIGLFGDESQQTDLLDLANKPAAPASAKSFDDIFDDVMAEEFGVAPPPKPRAPKKAKLKGEPTAAERKAMRDAPTWAEILAELPTHSDGRTRQHEIAFDAMKEIAGKTKYADLTPAQKVELLAKLKAEKPRTAGEAAKSAAKNAAMGLDDVVSGLTKLFGGDKLSSGISFDEQTYRQALPYFKAGVAHFKEAAQDLTEVIRALVKHLRSAGMDADAIQKMRPYIQRFTDDIASGKESLDAPGSGDVLEPDSGTATAGDRVGAADVSAAAGADGSSVDARGNETVARDERPGVGVGLPQDHAPVLGEDGHLELPHREPEPADSDAPAGIDQRSDTDSAPGLPLEPVTADEAVRLAEKEANLAERRAAQRAAESIPAKPGDAANIDATLPMLFPEQRDDVLKTEERFAKPNGHGMLLTNGTGTGKTYSGLGVIKRFAKQGKTNIAIVAPSQGILMDWVRSAKDLGLDVSILESTQDAGEGIIATTYANFGQNRHLADREWDLIVPDEAHKLSSDQNGTPTAALGTLRAITLHPDGLMERARMVLRKEWDAIPKLEKNATNEQLNEHNRIYAAFQAKADALIGKWRGQDRPKVLMMSATPFAYHFSLDYAEGYLFEFEPPGTTVRAFGYNVPNARDAFYMQNLGYRMRTNKLTKPDADVRSEVMERELHERLKREGALAGRALTVDKDYDRKFILVNDAVGHQIDRALSFLQEADNGKFRALGEIVGKRFDYLARMRLLEAIKAEASIDYIKKSLALGRKVVVFHDYNEGGGSSPFHMSFGPEETVSRYVDGKYETVKLADLYDEFRAQNPYVDGLDFSSYASPLRAIQKAFPDALIYNGTVPVKVRDKAKKLFNDDTSGRDIIVVQSAAGEAGISLHDTTGKKQRVLLNLGMPVRPTTSIQQEGRIYRVGQATDAMFRYMNTGTNWERWTFAGKIAERAGTAENLALGNLARTIRQSFIDSFNDADTFEPTTGEGTGGKEADKAMSHSLSEFDKAKTHYFAQGKKTGRRDQREGIDYFATPEPVGLKMVEFANIKPGEKVLEPSAGHGAIARYFPEDSARTMIEPSNDLASRAAMTSPGARVVVDRFENFNIVNKYDAIVMNPPFGSGGKTAIDHIEKAVAHLKNGGRIVALIPRGPSADKRFDKFMDGEEAKGIYIVGNILLPTVTFERAGTSVAARIVVLEKQTDEDTARGLQQKDRDYTNAETINELFDRIEQADMGQRREPVTKEADVATEGNVTVDGIEFNLRTSQDGQSYFADLKSYIPARFRTVAKAAEAFGGAWVQGSKLFTFESQEKRAQFLDRVANPPPEDAATAAQPGVAFNLAQTKHSKTGADLFVAALKDRVDRDQYTSLNSTAKANGGWYSAFRGAGAIPGFQFKSEADRAKFIAVVSGETKPDVQASLGRITEPSTAPAPTLSPEKRANLESALSDVVRRIVGPDVVVRFSDTIPLTKPPQGWGSYQSGVQTAAGAYIPAEHLLRVALADPAYPLEQVLDTTFHEAFHAVENRLLTDDELDVLKREDARLRSIIKQAYGFTDDQVRDFAGFEVRAIAFEHYASQRAQGIAPEGFHIAIRRAFERLMNLFRQIANYVRGLGFQSADSIFAAAYEGEFATRQQEEAGEPKYSVRRKPTEKIHLAYGIYIDEGGYVVKDEETRRNVAGPFEKRDDAVAARKEIWANETQANIRQETPPRGNLNTHDSFEPLPEQWQDWWKQPDLKWSDRVWGMIDAAFLPANRAIGDKYVDMRRMQAAVEAAGRPVGENIDMALNASLFEGRTEKRLKDYWLRTWKPVLDRAAAAGISREDLHTYLYARHAPERNERIAEINEDMPDGGSGMTNDEAQEIMDGFNASGQREALERIAQDVDGIVRSIREMMVADQLENERTTEAWSRSYQHYVPLKGFEAGDESIGVGADGRSGGFDVRGPETRRALGRSSKADDVLSNLFLMGERTIIRGEQNRVARSAMRFMQSNPQPSLFTIQRAERVLVDARPETVRQEDLDLLLGERPVTVEIRNPQTGLVTVVTKVASQFAKDTFAAKIGGHTYYITIKHPGLLAALKNVGVQRLPMLIRAHAWLTRQFAAFRTARNPDWFIANLSRDIQDAAYTVSAEQREALLKNFAANIATLRTYMAAFMGEAMEGNGLIGKWARSKFADKRGVAAYEAWKKAGGQIAFMGIHDLESAKDEIERAFRATEGESWMKSIAMAGPHAARGLLKAIEYFNGAIESGTRLAVFDAAIKAGLTPAKAAMLSKESTTNFNRKGIYSPFINSFYAFFNARVQGAIKHVRLLRTSKMARKAALGLIVGGFATTMWNLAAAPDDEEDKKNKYAKRKYWERERYFILYMPGSSEPFRMPMGFGLQLFWMLGENLAMLSQGKITPAEAAVNYLSTIVGAFSPFSAEGSPVDPGTWLRLMMPSIETPLVDLYTNENWRRKPIHPKFGAKGQPHSEQYFTTTSPVAIDMAQFLNRTTGGNAFKPGKIDLYPGDLQYVWEFAAGGLGQTVNRTDAMVRNWVNGVPTPVNQIPVLRHFVGQDTKQTTTEGYYEDRDAVQKGMSQVRKALKTDTTSPKADDAASTIEGGKAQFGVKDGKRKGTVTSDAEALFRAADKEIKELRGQESTVRADPTMNRAEKAKLIDTIRTNIRQVQEETRGKYRKLKDATAP